MRNGINPNVAAPPVDATARVEIASNRTLAEAEAIRTAAAVAGEALDETLPAASADARREVPRLRTEARNPRMDVQFPGPGATRSMLSSNKKKRLNKAKGEWLKSLPKTRHDAMSRLARSRQQLESLNSSLREVVGIKSDLPPNLRRRIERIDRSIQDHERNNAGQHLVYTVLRPPREHGNSRNAMIRRLEAMTKNDGTLTFDGYIPATHSLGNITSNEREVVMEIRTRSGAYLGTSDTTPDANHIIGRGRVLRPVSVQEVTYVRPDGTQGTRTVVQMDDVTPDNPTT